MGGKTWDSNDAHSRRATSEIWVAEDPDPMIHFHGEHFRGQYPSVMPTKQ